MKKWEKKLEKWSKSTERGNLVIMPSFGRLVKGKKRKETKKKRKKKERKEKKVKREGKFERERERGK